MDKVATAVANEVYEKIQPAELMDTQVMYLHAHGPGLLHTRKKAVRKLEDVKGLKIRSHGTSAKIVEALGGTAVAKPMPETYQLLQKGVVDGAVYPLESNKGWKLAEVVDYVTLCYPAAYTTTFFVVMNKDKWNALPDDVKKTIQEINKEWIAKTGEAWDAIDQEGADTLKEKKRGSHRTVSAEEGARWAAKPSSRSWASTWMKPIKRASPATRPWKAPRKPWPSTGRCINNSPNQVFIPADRPQGLSAANLNRADALFSPTMSTGAFFNEKNRGFPGEPLEMDRGRFHRRHDVL